MLEDGSQCCRVVWPPALRDDDRGVVGLAARAQDLITHYPDFGDRREADAVVQACGRQLLDRQSNSRLDRKAVAPVGMVPQPR